MPNARQILLPAALFFTLLPFAGYQSGPHQWAMLSDLPAGAIASAVVAAVMWAAYALQPPVSRRARDHVTPPR